MPKGRPQDYNVPGKAASGVKPGSPSAMKGLMPPGKASAKATPPGKPAAPGKAFGQSLKGVGRMGKGRGSGKSSR